MRVLPSLLLLSSSVAAFAPSSTPSRAIVVDSSTRLDKWRRTKATWKSGPGQTPIDPVTLPHLKGVAPVVPAEAPAAPEASSSAAAGGALQFGGMPAPGVRKEGGYGIGSGAAGWKTAAPASTAAASFAGVVPSMQTAVVKAAVKKSSWGIGSNSAKWKTGGAANVAAAAPAATAAASFEGVVPSMQTAVVKSSWGIGANSAKWKANGAVAPAPANGAVAPAAPAVAAAAAKKGWGIGSGAAKWKTA